MSNKPKSYAVQRELRRGMKRATQYDFAISNQKIAKEMQKIKSQVLKGTNNV